MTTTDSDEKIELDQICSLCQSIFVGPLNYHDSPKLPKEPSIHIDCWDCRAPQPNIFSRSWTYASGLVGSLASNCYDALSDRRPGAPAETGSPEDESSTHSQDPYLPNELRMDKYRFIHMGKYYQPCDDDLDEIATAEFETLPRIPQFMEAQKPFLTPWKRYGTHHRTTASFLESVKTGCEICSEIRTAMSKFTDEYLENTRAYDSGFTTYGVYYFPSFGSCRVVFHPGFPEEPDNQFIVHKPVLDLHYRPHQVYKPSLTTEREQIEDDVELVPAANYKVISSWLDDCDYEHHCGLPTFKSPTHYMPTRVLRVGENDDDPIKLVTTKDEQITDIYATLSYCWGNSGVPLKLLSHLLPEFQSEGIPAASLPKTLLEATQVARELGIRYIWIDSLCIIQDSASDWNTEAAKMADIYNNSYCNFAATNSHSCEDGLVNMPATSSSPSKHQGLINIDSYWFPVGYKRLQLLDFDIIPNNINEAPLNQRGWVLQERYLAPRTIHFGRRQLFWECYEHLACETHPTGLPTGPRFSGAKLNLSLPLATASSTTTNPYLTFGRHPYGIPPSTGSLTFTPHNYWWLLVRRYSATQLTHPTDKLIAISGLARRIGALLQSGDTSEEYLAGLWRSHFVSDMVWVSDGPCVPTPGVYVGPSWSWVSHTGTITANETYDSGREGQRAFVAVVEVDVTCAVGGDRYGAVSGGWVKLRGRLFRAAVMLTTTTMEVNGFDARWWWMCFEDEGVKARRRDYGRPAWLEREPEVKNGWEVCCLPVLLYGEFLYCVLLEGTGKKGEYRRIGMYKAGGDWKEDILVLETAFEEAGGLDTPGVGELYDDEGTFTII